MEIEINYLDPVGIAPPLSHLLGNSDKSTRDKPESSTPFFGGGNPPPQGFLPYSFHVRGKGPKICEAFCCMVPVLFSSPDRSKSADSTSAALAPSKAERPKLPKTPQILINFTAVYDLHTREQAISTCKGYGVAVPMIACVISYSTCLGLDLGFCACRSYLDPSARSQILSSTE